MSASLVLVLTLLSGCSTLPQQKEPQPLPMLTSLVKMDRGGQPGVWMNEADAANLTLWLEGVCR